jgi:hypothetical protein
MPAADLRAKGRPLRTLICSEYYPPYIGGVQRQTRARPQQFVERGHEVCVATVYEHHLSAYEDIDGYPVHRLKQLRPHTQFIGQSRLKAAIAKFLGACWQRCTVHFLRDCLGHARRDQHGLLGAVIRPILNATDRAQARDRLSEAVAHLQGRLAKVATLLEQAEEEVLAFYAFPRDHRTKIRSTTRWSASTKSSAAAPTSSASSPTTSP